MCLSNVGGRNIHGTSLVVQKAESSQVAPRNDPLTKLSGCWIREIPSRHSGAGNKRKLRVTAVPNMTLTMQHVPQHCRRARTVLLGPLTPHDLDAASFISFKQGGHLLGVPPAVNRLCCAGRLSDMERLCQGVGDFNEQQSPMPLSCRLHVLSTACCLGRYFLRLCKPGMVGTPCAIQGTGGVGTLRHFA